MYNTDRRTAMIDVGAVQTYSIENPEDVYAEFILPNEDGTEVGKEWVRGYEGPRPHTFRNMGTEKGRKRFDIRNLIRNLEYHPIMFWDDDYFDKHYFPLFHEMLAGKGSKGS